VKHTLLLLLLMLSALALFGRTGDETGPDVAVAIYTRFAYPPSPRVFQQMKTELAAIMAPLRFDWFALKDANGHQSMAELVVVSFNGVCRDDPVAVVQPPSGNLGWTYFTHNEILPYAFVDCDRIRGLIEQALAVSPPAERARLMGRGMARVLAHELYHFLTQTRNHASSGLGKAVYTGADLVSDHFQFGAAQSRLLRQSWQHLQAETAQQ